MTSDATDDPNASEYMYPPNCTLDPSIKALITRYYKQVDIQGKHVEYSECFVRNGTLVVSNGQEFTGREAIRDLHSSMWNGAPRWLHRPQKVFPFGDHADEVVIIGTVEYWPEDGSYKKQDMAVRVKYQNDATTGKAKILRLQVWLTG